MSDTDGKEEVKSFYEEALEHYNRSMLGHDGNSNAADFNLAVKFAQLSLAESAYTYLAMMQGRYNEGIGRWLWEVVEEAGYSEEDLKDPTSPIWTEVVPGIMERVLELKAPSREIDV